MDTTENHLFAVRVNGSELLDESIGESLEELFGRLAPENALEELGISGGASIEVVRLRFIDAETPVVTPLDEPSLQLLSRIEGLASRLRHGARVSQAERRLTQHVMSAVDTYGRGIPLQCEGHHYKVSLTWEGPSGESMVLDFGWVDEETKWRRHGDGPWLDAEGCRVNPSVLENVATNIEGLGGLKPLAAATT